MREMIKMVVVLVFLSSLSGGLLAALNDGTKARIKDQQLEFVKGPAIRTILAGCSNDPVADRFTIKDGEVEHDFFVGKFNGKSDTIAFESFGGGFGGDVGVMVGVNTTTDKIVGIGVTTHSETPGVGSKAKSDSFLVDQFKGLPLGEEVKVKTDNGQVDAISGATVTSKGVCAAVTGAGKTYKQLKPQLTEKLKDFSK
jgi:electron transport complex protein RnfG